MRRRTSLPRLNSAMPSRYLPLSGFCSSIPSVTSVVARRCAVLLATPRRLASVLMPISTSSSENAFSSRSAVPTDDSRPGAAPLSPLSWLLTMLWLGRSSREGEPGDVPLRGPAFRSIVRSRPPDCQRNGEPPARHFLPASPRALSSVA